MKSTNFYKYFLNCFVLTIPTMITNTLLTDKLPQTSKPVFMMATLKKK